MDNYCRMGGLFSCQSMGIILRALNYCIRKSGFCGLTLHCNPTNFQLRESALDIEAFVQLFCGCPSRMRHTRFPWPPKLALQAPFQRFQKQDPEFPDPVTAFTLYINAPYFTTIVLLCTWTFSYITRSTCTPERRMRISMVLPDWLAFIT